MADFIVCYRVSTDRQGASGLGIDVQRRAVPGFVGTGQLLAEFTGTESGHRHTNRPQLLAGLAECHKRRAALLIVRLDRLARNVAFISALTENSTDFIAGVMPQASRLTIHIPAAVAEHEREMISKQTKAAIAGAKLRGTKSAAKAHRALRPAPEVSDLTRGWREKQWTLRRIADEPNGLDIRPARGRQRYASSVRNQLCNV
jgi:DNA invertase Pin-like site-specific DNA recombinase